MTEGSVGLSADRRDEFPEQVRGRVRAGVLAGAVVAILIGLYSPVFPVWLDDLWHDPNYSHVFIIPMISGFLLWQRRRVLAAVPIHGNWRGVPLILAGVAALI